MGYSVPGGGREPGRATPIERRPRANGRAPPSLSGHVALPLGRGLPTMRTLACSTLASLVLAPLAALSPRAPGGAAASGPLDPRAQQELSADLSLGKVVDREGVASVRAATEERWRCAE